MALSNLASYILRRRQSIYLLTAEIWFHTPHKTEDTPGGNVGGRWGVSLLIDKDIPFAFD